MVLEAGPEIGHTWRSRWDSLTLFTPAQYDALPGMPFPGPPDTYPTKDPVADYLQAYAAAFNLPVRLNARVTHLSQTAEGFEIRTQDEVFRARQVVVATGPFQVPFVPPAAQRLDGSVTQLHSAGYRNPQALPPGPVLVVGGGNSGFQIAEELAASRQVDLSIATKIPSAAAAAGWQGPVLVAHPAWGSCGSPSTPGSAAGCPAGISSSAAAAAGSRRPGSGSGRQWPTREDAPSASPTAPAWTPAS